MTKQLHLTWCRKHQRSCTFSQEHEQDEVELGSLESNVLQHSAAVSPAAPPHPQPLLGIKSVDQLVLYQDGRICWDAQTKTRAILNLGRCEGRTTESTELWRGRGCLAKAQWGEGLCTRTPSTAEQSHSSYWGTQTLQNHSKLHQWEWPSAGTDPTHCPRGARRSKPREKSHCRGARLSTAQEKQAARLTVMETALKTCSMSIWAPVLSLQRGLLLDCSAWGGHFCMWVL